MLLNFTSLSKPSSSPILLVPFPFILLHLTHLQEIKKSTPSIKHTTFYSIRIWEFRDVFRYRFQIQNSFKILLNTKLPSQLPKVNKSFFPYFISLAPSYKLGRKPIICRQIQLGGKGKKKVCSDQSRKTNKQTWEHQENQEPLIRPSSRICIQIL